MAFRAFLHSENGGVSVDWVVLSAALVGTGVAVISTVSQGIEALSNDMDSAMRGQIIRTTFSQEFCEGGLHKLQQKEDARVATAIAQGDDPQAIDVEQWMRIAHSEDTDQDLVTEYQETLAAIDPDAPWDRDHTVLGALECAMAIRGLS